MILGAGVVGVSSAWYLSKAGHEVTVIDRQPEAAMFAGFHKVDNVVAIVDNNGIQLDGFVKDIMDLSPLADKWRSFGWHVIEADGHDIPALQKAFAEASSTKGKPTALIAHTVKGKGVSFMENNPKYHGQAPTLDEEARALAELV